MNLMMDEPYHPLPIALVERGFDVWIDGNRGSTYQRKHESFDVTNDEYWDFSFAEMGEEDQAAQIDYIL